MKLAVSYTAFLFVCLFVCLFFNEKEDEKIIFVRILPCHDPLPQDFKWHYHPGLVGLTWKLTSGLSCGLSLHSDAMLFTSPSDAFYLVSYGTVG